MRKFRVVKEGNVPVIEMPYEPGRVTVKLRYKLVHLYLGMYDETGWRSVIIGRPFLDPDGLEVIDVVIGKHAFWLKFKGCGQTFKVSEVRERSIGFLF